MLNLRLTIVIAFIIAIWYRSNSTYTDFNFQSRRHIVLKVRLAKILQLHPKAWRLTICKLRLTQLGTTSHYGTNQTALLSESINRRSCPSCMKTHQLWALVSYWNFGTFFTARIRGVDFLSFSFPWKMFVFYSGQKLAYKHLLVFETKQSYIRLVYWKEFRCWRTTNSNITFI